MKQTFSESTDGFGKKRLLRSEQKLAELMEDLVSKFSYAGELELNICAVTFAAAKVCLQLPHHCRFIGFQTDSACFQTSHSLLMQLYAL